MDCKQPTRTPQFNQRSALKLAMQKAELLQEKAKKNRAEAKPSTEPVHVRKAIAEDAKVSEDTVRKYMRIITKGDADLLKLIDNGELKIGTAHRMLEVRVVEELKQSPEAIAKGKVHAAKCALDNIQKIETLYGFITNQPWFVNGHENTKPIEKLLEQQLKLAWRLACRAV